MKKYHMPIFNISCKNITKYHLSKISLFKICILQNISQFLCTNHKKKSYIYFIFKYVHTSVCVYMLIYISKYMVELNCKKKMLKKKKSTYKKVNK